MIFEQNQEAGIDQAMFDEQREGAGVGMERVPSLLNSLNSLSAISFATISVTERQVVLLQDLHRVFSTSYQTKTKDGEKEYLLRENPFFKDIVLTPILSEYPERGWPNILGTIDEVVGERKSFIKKIKGLIENMGVKRKIV